MTRAEGRRSTAEPPRCPGVVNFEYTYLGPTLEILIPRGWDGRLFLKQPTDIMLASQASNLCSLTGPHANKGPILSLILCHSHHNILFFVYLFK